MKVLFFNHCFEPDMEAMSFAKHGHEIRIVSACDFGVPSHKFFPDEVRDIIDCGFQTEKYAANKAAWHPYSYAIFNDLRRQFAFDVIIAPSDTFYYVRSLVEHCQEAGIPFIVLQKETTISPMAMEHHAQELKRNYPFIGDLMLVCSERHKQFWITAGSKPENIIVTGQPRFDLYRQPGKVLPLEQLGVRLDRSRPTILFLSYYAAAYAPEGTIPGTNTPTWQQLRDETELSLALLAREGFNVIIKPHPQQYHNDAMCIADQTRYRALAGDSWEKSFFLLDKTLDCRHLIMNSDIVVGFQSTAMLEAMVAGKETILTNWTHPVERFQKSLIPLHMYKDCIFVANSPIELIQRVRSWKPGAVDPVNLAQRYRYFADELGPTDGLSAARSWKEIEKFVASRSKPLNEQTTMTVSPYLRPATASPTTQQSGGFSAHNLTR